MEQIPFSFLGSGSGLLGRLGLNVLLEVRIGSIPVWLIGTTLFQGTPVEEAVD